MSGKLKIHVDQDKCQGHARCKSLAPELFNLDEFGNAHEVGDGTVHLHCTDIDGEWLISSGGGEVTVTREHAKGDVAARGTASDLLLFVWGRVPADALEVFGDTDLLARFRQAVKV